LILRKTYAPLQSDLLFDFIIDFLLFDFIDFIIFLLFDFIDLLFDLRFPNMSSMCTILV